MAGAGFKTFNTGDVLTASDVNTYLMQQTVMVFASAAARTTALGANVAEGMLSYLKDTDAVEVYNGSAWVSSDDPNAIQNTIVDAKGDLISATAADTPARLAVGTNGQVLTADSTQSTGLKWATPAAGGFFKNPVLNSNFSVWQRGTSFTGTGTYYTADRWQGVRAAAAAGGTWSRQTTSDTTNLPFIQYAMRVQRDSGNTGTGALNLVQTFESVNSLPFIGKTVTLSFYARKGANFSATSDTLNFSLDSGTGTDQNDGVTGSFTGLATPISSTATLTTTWQRFSATGTVSSSATQLGMTFKYTPTGTASTNDWFEITGVQLEIGSSATDYYPNGNTYQAELAACQRYYQVIASGASKAICNLMAYSASAAFGVIDFNTTMRTTPTIVQVSGTNYFKVEGNETEDLFDAFNAIYFASDSRTGIGITSGITITKGYAYWVWSNNASALLALQAEL